MNQPISASDEWRKSPGKKDTRRWCKGKVGREHTIDIRRIKYGWYVNADRVRCDYIRNLYPWWERAPYYRNRGDEWVCHHERFCTTCGKILSPLDSNYCPDRPKDE